jgi:hypothetical protein
MAKIENYSRVLSNCKEVFEATIEGAEANPALLGRVFCLSPIVWRN